MKKFLVTLLIIILVAVIGVGGYFLYQLNEKIDNLSAEKEEPATNNEVVNNVTPVEPTTNTVIEPTEPAQTTTLTEAEALEIGEELYENINHSGELINSKIKTTDETYEIDGDNYAKITNYDQAIRDQYTREAEERLFAWNEREDLYQGDTVLEDAWLGMYTTKDGEYYFNVDAGGKGYYWGEWTDMNVVSIEDDTIKFEVVHIGDDPYAAELFEGETTTTVEFVIKKEDGKWKIDSYEDPQHKVSTQIEE